jgi:hypothetical protein
MGAIVVSLILAVCFYLEGFSDFMRAENIMQQIFALMAILGGVMFTCAFLIIWGLHPKVPVIRE